MVEIRYFSQLGQDRWVAEMLGFKREGFFLEFGSLDGFTANNTLALEQYLGWRGICVEANPTYYPLVCKNRSSITINAAIWAESRHQLEMCDAYGLTSAVAHIDGDTMADHRRRDTKRNFYIDTISPNELLARFDVPPIIDFMSLDIEGAELDVLRAIDFDRYPIASMAVEHSFVEDRQRAMVELLQPKGYVFLERHQDFLIVHPDHLAQLGPYGPEDAIRALEVVARDYEVLAV